MTATVVNDRNGIEAVTRPRSARTRIVVWLVSLVLAALVVNQLIATRILLSRVNRNLAAEIEHEHRKFNDFMSRATTGSDAAGQPVSNLLDEFLITNIPEPSETFFSVVDGQARSRSGPEPLARLDKDPVFVDLVAATTSPASGTWSTSAGEAVYGIFPVRHDPTGSWSQMVAIEFAAPARDSTIATLRTLAAVSIAALVAGAIAAWLVAGRILRPVRQVRDTAESIGESDLSRRIDVRGDDEVAQLARTFNRMLDRIESAFSTQREFLDDAGHELRTPLTVIRGHLDLIGSTEAERAATLALVDDELSRMSRIVDDLLMLARSERPDFIRLAPLNMTDLTVDSLTKAQALGERQWKLEAIAEVTVMADGERLTQALMQLVTNAVEHTSTGGTIALGSAIQYDRLVVWVTDDGEGIDEEDQDRVFDRFATFAGRRRDSTGLGLTIVRSIAESHGGTARVQSTIGEGSKFILDLPLHQIATPDTVPQTEAQQTPDRALSGADQ